MLERVETDVQRLCAGVAETIRLKEVEVAAGERRLATLVDVIGEGRGSPGLAAAVIETEHRVGQLLEEVEGLRRSRDRVFQLPAVEWIEERLASRRALLGRAA